MDESHGDLDLIDISNWNSEFSTADQLKLFDLPSSTDPQTPQINQSIFNSNVVDPSGDFGDSETVGSMQSMTNPSGFSFGIKKNVIPTITTIYEPKFLEIFNAYRQYALTYESDIDLTNISQQHLMVLCLNNLVSFSNWARDPHNSAWIRENLFENPDMRPEVRNGISLILLYTFSAAKAHEENMLLASSGSSTAFMKTVDMFSILGRNDQGFGIVNKTSLKIYSDPLNYFNFLKSCISGLIDAAAIPENERQNLQNQQTKKSRRTSKNKDELEAYIYIKTTLCTFLSNPETVILAREKIKQILDFWGAKGKTIRNERFASVFSLPATPSGAGSTPMTVAESDDATTSAATSNMMGGGGGGGGNVMSNSTSSSGIPGLAVSVPNSRNPSTASQQGFGFSSRTSGRSSAGSLNIDTSGMSNATSTFHQTRERRVSSNNSMGSYIPNMYGAYSVDDSDSMSSSSRSPHPSMHESMPGVPGPPAVNTNAGGTSPYYSPATKHPATAAPPPVFIVADDPTKMVGIQAGLASSNSFTMPPAGAPAPSFAPAVPALNSNTTVSIPVPAIRFDRIGNSKWTLNNTLLYDLTALQSNTSQGCTFYLVDESKLNSFVQELSGSLGIAAEQPAMKGNVITLSSQFMAQTGMNSVSKILQASGALITCWNKPDYPQLQRFIESWNSFQQQQQEDSAHHMESDLGDSSDDNADSHSIWEKHSDSGTVMTTSDQLNANSKRTLRRRTTGGVELKRDMARLKEFQEQQQLQQLRQLQISDSRSGGRSTVSLLHYWHRTVGIATAATARSKGVIVYEVSLEVGLIVRANQQHGIPDDIWATYFADDVMGYFQSLQHVSTPPSPGMFPNIGSISIHPPPIETSFSAFLALLLPQARHLPSIVHQRQQWGNSGGSVSTMGSAASTPMMGMPGAGGSGGGGGSGGSVMGMRPHGYTIAVQPHYAMNPSVIGYDEQSLASGGGMRMQQRKANTFSFTVPQPTGNMSVDSLRQFQMQYNQQQQQMQQMQSSVVTVSYYAHMPAPGQTQMSTANYPLLPPFPPAIANSYRTIGSLDQGATQLLSRFADGAYFHEIVLR